MGVVNDAPEQLAASIDDYLAARLHTLSSTGLVSSAITHKNFAEMLGQEVAQPTEGTYSVEVLIRDGEMLMLMISYDTHESAESVHGERGI